MTVYSVDLDVDSDNNSVNNNNEPDVFGLPAQTLTEDRLEQLTTESGKMVGINNDDDDLDGTIDSEDGYYSDSQPDSPEEQMINLAGEVAEEQFVPMILALPTPLDPDSCQVKLTYNTDVFRVWRQGRGTPRKASSVVSGGDLVPSGTPIPFLAFQAEEPAVTLYVEALALTNPLVDTEREVTVEVDPTAEPSFVASAQDIVRICPLEIVATNDTFTMDEDTHDSIYNLLDVINQGTIHDHVLPSGASTPLPSLTSVGLAMHGDTDIDAATPAGPVYAGIKFLRPGLLPLCGE